MKAHLHSALAVLLAIANSHANGQQVFSGPEVKGPADPIARIGIERFKGRGRPFALAFSPDSKTLVMGCWDGDVLTWDVAKRQLLLEWPAHTGPIEALAVSPDGTMVASGGDDKEIRVWQISTGARKLSLQGNRREIEHLAYSPDGSLLASTDAKGVAVWDLAPGKQRFRLDRSLFQNGVATAFTGESSVAMLTFTKGKPTLETVEAPSGKQQSLIGRPNEFSDSGALSPSGKWFVRIENGVRVLNLATKRDARYFKGDGHFVRIGGAYALVISADERLVGIALNDRTEPTNQVVIMELATGLVRGRYRWPDQCHACFAFSPDGRYLASASADRSALLWDLTGRELKGKAAPVALAAADLDRLWGDLSAPDGVAVQRAIWALAAGAADSVPFLKAKLLPVGATSERIASLVRDLDNGNFKVRAGAEAELEKLHDEAEAALRKAMGDAPLEMKRRVEKLLDLIESQWTKGHMARGIEALEHCRTPEARKVLEQLEANAFSPRRADEARAALRRLPRDGQ
jgi:hypothetical protein